MAKLHYTGPRLSTGEPERSLILDGIPIGDLDSDDLAPDQVKTALDSGLYAWATPDSRAAKEAEAAAEAAAKQAAAAAQAELDRQQAGGGGTDPTKEQD